MVQKLVTRLFASSIVLIAAVTGSPVEKRSCNHNNLLRGLLDADIRQDANAYCSSYLGIPVVTKTVATIYPSVYVPQLKDYHWPG